MAGIAPSVTHDEFDRAIAAVHDALREGESYQINYTFWLNVDVFGAPIELYRRLRERQTVRYGAFIAMPDGRAVVSCSPELFIQKHGDVLRTARASDERHRAARGQSALAQRRSEEPRRKRDEIVDLLRNDMSRVAVTGSVHRSARSHAATSNAPTNCSLAMPCAAA